MRQAANACSTTHIGTIHTVRNDSINEFTRGARAKKKAFLYGKMQSL
jgi:hypothetical protein